MASVTRNCLVCGTLSTKSCAVCKTASYCDAEHQKQDWRSHKEYCCKIKAAGANTFDAILFPVNETKPRLVKIPWKLIPGDEYEPMPYQRLDTDIWFKHTPKCVRNRLIRQLGINGPELGRTLTFIYDDNFSINESPLNHCVVEVTGGRAAYPWCGNILALRMDSEKTYAYGFYTDVDMQEDLKLFVTYFEEYATVKPIR